jgi:hypothetical protein
MPDIVWTAVERDDAGRVAFRVGRRGSSLVAEWPELGVLTASADGARHEFVPAKGVASEDVERVARTKVRALVAHLRGGIALHASGVAVTTLGARRAVVLVGPSGAGKSTTAEKLRQGYDAELLADDVAPLAFEGPSVMLTPSEHETRLLPDAEAALSRAPGANDRRAASPAPLCLVVALRFDESAKEPCFDPLEGHAAFDAIRRAMYRLVVDDPSVAVRDVDMLAQLCARVPVMTLRRPRDLRALDASAALVIDALRARSE